MRWSGLPFEVFIKSQNRVYSFNALQSGHIHSSPKAHLNSHAERDSFACVTGKLADIEENA